MTVNKTDLIVGDGGADTLVHHTTGTYHVYHESFIFNSEGQSSHKAHVYVSPFTTAK